MKLVVFHVDSGLVIRENIYCRTLLSGLMGDSAAVEKRGVSRVRHAPETYACCASTTLTVCHHPAIQLPALQLDERQITSVCNRSMHAYMYICMHAYVSSVYIHIYICIYTCINMYMHISFLTHDGFELARCVLVRW